MAFSKKVLLDTTRELAATSATSLSRAKAAGPAQPTPHGSAGRIGMHAEGPVLLAGCGVLVQRLLYSHGRMLSVDVY